MDIQAHWEQVYGSKSPGETSWYEARLQTSLDWISDAAIGCSVSIIDVGGGESTLVDDLLARGYGTLTVLDVAGAAIRKSQKRLGLTGKSVNWLVGNVTTLALPGSAYDIWHDRAVFHFLIDPKQRFAYVRQIASALKIGGQVIMATFGPQGPQRCSGLDTKRYDTESLSREMGASFRLVRSATVVHQTPKGMSQQFLYCQFGFNPS